eukprot:3677642-Prymnesium_polylepis.1
MPLASAAHLGTAVNASIPHSTARSAAIGAIDAPTREERHSHTYRLSFPTETRVRIHATLCASALLAPSARSSSPP